MQHVFTTIKGNTMMYSGDFPTAVKLAAREAKLSGDKVAYSTTIKTKRQ